MAGSIVAYIKDTCARNRLGHLTRGKKDGLIRSLSLNDTIRLSPRDNTPLHFAARMGDKIMVESLLSLHPSLLIQKNSKDNTPLHMAAKFGRTHVIESLIQYAKNGGILCEVLSVKNMEGNTPLHEAARNGHSSTVLLFVNELKVKGPDLLVSLNNAGESPLFLAVDAKSSETVETIIQAEPSSLLDTDPTGQTPLHRAILRADFNTMAIILKRKPQLVDKQDSNGRSPLHYAAASGALDTVHCLIAELTAPATCLPDNHLATPAHMAAENGQVRVLQVLLNCFPDSVELHNTHGQNILHVAAKNGQVDVVQYIKSLSSELDDLINEPDEDGNTPLHLAAMNFHSSIISTLTAGTEKADVLAKNKKNQTALDIAIAVSPDSLIGNVDIRATISQCQTSLDKIKLEAIEREKQITIQILKAASAKQARNLDDTLKHKNIKEFTHDTRQNEMVGHILVVATLVATVTFTAAFTVPGGVEQNTGSDQGMAVLTKKAAFRAFVVTDTIAMTLSMMTVVILLASSWTGEVSKWRLPYFPMLSLWLALLAMGLAFVTGFFAVLSEILALGIVVVVIGAVFPALVYLLVPHMFPEDPSPTQSMLAGSIVGYIWTGKK